MMKDLVIIGASGFGREVAWLVERINAVKPTWNLLGYFDDNVEIHGSLIGGYPVLGGCDQASVYQDTYYVCAVGVAKTRKVIITKLESLVSEPHYATLIDPSVIISNRVRIGMGCIICAGNIITVDINIGNHVIINLDCTVGHDANLCDFVTVYPSANISGITEISECVELGTGAQVIQGMKIGKETIVGAGSVVIKDLPDKCTAVGCPAKPIKYHGDALVSS